MSGSVGGSTALKWDGGEEWRRVFHFIAYYYRTTEHRWKINIYMQITCVLTTVVYFSGAAALITVV